MTNQTAAFVPPSAEGLPPGALDSAADGADRLDAMAGTPYGRNFLAHALVQLARDGWLRAEPGEGFEPQRDRETPEPEDASSAGPAPATDRAALREQVAAAARTVRLRLGPNAIAMAQRGEPIILNLNEADDLAAAVLAVLPDQAAVRAAALHEAADAVRNGAFADTLRRMADETPQPETRDEETALLRLTVDAVEEGRRELRSENARLRAQLWTLAAMFEGFARLLATSSRDWGQYAPDAWLWAVICGWDCEDTEHDDTCVHGAMEEMQQRHGWDDAAVAKARRYRAVVRVITEPAPAVVAQPDGEAERVVRCSLAILNRPHEPHGWYPQPGMDPVDCPGHSFTEEA
jgi:hypothetical protein